MQRLNNTKALRKILLAGLFITFITAKATAQQTSPAGSSASDSLNVTGTITEAASAAPLSGINISVTDYSAAITDENGNFNIKVPNYNAVLNVSAQDYQNKAIVLKGRHRISASLYAEPFNSFYDPAVLPFGTKPKDQIVYAISSVNTDDKWESSTTETAGSYLQGRVPGLDAVRRSGTPGIGANLFLRGVNSLEATNQPLIVVDGMIYDNNEYGNSIINGHVYNPLADIDIKDIDNITVIKSGTSTYGTRGANGVILITTARAKELATRIDFAAYGGVNTTVSELPVMQARDYRIYLSDLLQTNPGMADSIQQQPYMNDNPNAPGYYSYHYNTDWQRQVMHNSYNQNYYLKVTGGDDIAMYALSLGYLKNAGITDNTDLTRSQTRFNADLNLSKKLKASINLSYVSSVQNLKNQGIAPQTNPLYLALTKAPILPVHVVSDEGIESPNLSGYDIFNVSNPVSIVDNMQGANKNYRFNGSVNFVYQLNKDISLRTLLGVTFDKVRENLFIPQMGVLPDTLSKAVAKNKSGSNVERLYTLYNDTRFTYDHIFNRIHHFTANIGFRFNNSKSEQEYGYDYNSATDEFVSVGMGDPSLRTVGGDFGRWNWFNTYVNADYALMNKYFLSFNMAVDGSSRFGKDAPDGISFNNNRYAVMPSIAGGWLISSERFMSNADFIDILKLRASYGLTGNDDIGNYAARQYYVSQNLLNLEGLVRGNIGNPALQWETVAKTDVGLDAAFLNERLNLSLDFYKNSSSNMITADSVNTAAGLHYMVTNNSAMNTKGFEASISGRLINKTFTWDMGVNLSTYKNTVTHIPGGSMETSFAGATYITKEGQAANLFYGYKTEGVFASDAEAQNSGLMNVNADGSLVPFKGGDIHFMDVNGDHIIDQMDRQVIGNPNPKWTGGFTNNFSWKQWSLDALFTFSAGNDIYNYNRAQLESMSGYENQTLAVVNRWRADGQQTDMPRAAWDDPSGNARFSDRWIEKGNYLRLRTISLTYSFPIKNSALKYMKIYATGNNIFTWTNYLGYDPEFSASESLFAQGTDLGLEPQFRTMQLGIRIGF